METVNISRSILICNIFQFFFASAKACLLPFLTLFFRLMGLNAVETGIIMAAKTLTGFVWAPLWARCAIAYNKRRIVLIFSLLIMATTYLSMTVVYNQKSNKQFSCNKSFHTTDSLPHVMVNTSTGANSGGFTVNTSTVTNSDRITVNTSTVANNDEISSTIKLIDTISPTAMPHKIIKHSTLVEHSISNMSSVVHVTTEASVNPIHKSKNKVSSSTISKLNLSNDDLQRLLRDYGAMEYVDEIKQGKLSSNDLFNMVSKIVPDSGFSKSDIEQVWNYLRAMPANDNKQHRRESKSLQKRDFTRSWSDIKDKMKVMMNALKEKELELFLIVLLLVVLGEFLSSPIEKVADDAWFDFLERIDDIEKYGKQRLSGSIAFIFIPAIVSLAVDYTECILPYNIHHFFIHVYLFAAFLGIAVIVAFFYPIPIPGKQKYISKVGQGMRIVCCDYRSFLYVVTLLLLGMVYASFNNFLFWHIQDLGGKEITMGMCVSIGALAEIPMLLFSGNMIRKLGNAGVISISLFAMALRVLYYSFLWTPWAVLPAELMHAFTHTAMWYAVLSYDDYNVGPKVDRSIRSILSSVYFGIGFSLGSVISGVVFEFFGSSVLYWAGSALCAAWSFVFLVVQKCIPKKERIRYIRLLPGDDGLDSGGDDEDWLELALKEQ